MPEQTATADASAPAPAAPAPTGAPPADATDALVAAFSAEDSPDSQPTPRAAPASATDAPPADADDLADEDAERLAQHPKVRAQLRREIDKREADKRAADQRAQQTQQQLEAAAQADRDLDEELAIANDPYHERYDEVNKKLTQSALMTKVRERALRDPQFQQAVTQHIEQVSQSARVAAVQGAIEQFGSDPDFSRVKPERLAELRQSPECDTVPKFAKALLREAGWLPPADVAKREKAAAEDARTRALGGWESRDFAPSEGRGGLPNGGAYDKTADPQAALEWAYRQEDARASNGRASAR